MIKGIRVEPEGIAYRAHIVGAPAVWEVGATPYEAIGRLIADPVAQSALGMDVPVTILRGNNPQGVSLQTDGAKPKTSI